MVIRMDKTITAVIKLPGKPATIEAIPDSLAELQRLVGGYIEIAMKAAEFYMGGTLVVYCNEDGQAMDLPPNIHRPTDGHAILGTVVAVKVDSGGESLTMTQTEADATLRLIGDMLWAA